MILTTKPVRLTRLGMCLDPFLNTGVTLPLVHSLGSCPDDIDMLKSLASGSAIHGAPSLRSLPGMLSGPDDFVGSGTQQVVDIVGVK